METNNDLAGIDDIPPDSSIMEALKEKESELKAETLEVRRRAEDIITGARAKSAETREQARREGAKKGKELISEGLAKAREQAKLIERETDKQIAEIEKQAASNFKAALRLVVNAVVGKKLPDQESAEDKRTDDVSTNVQS